MRLLSVHNGERFGIRGLDVIVCSDKMIVQGNTVITHILVNIKNIKDMIWYLLPNECRDSRKKSSFCQISQIQLPITQ